MSFPSLLTSHHTTLTPATSSTGLLDQVIPSRTCDSVHSDSESQLEVFVSQIYEVEESHTRPSATELVEPPADKSVAESQMKAAKTKATIGLLSSLISYVSLNSLYRTLNPDAFVWGEEDWEDTQWIATSRSWLDRKACRWLGVCGASHMHLIGSHFGHHVQHKARDDPDSPEGNWDWQNAWTEGKDRPEDWTDDERVLRTIPDYVLDHAPLVHLYSGEQFWPCDIAEHLYHITPTLNYTPLQPEWQHPTLMNLDKLNEWNHGRHIFLTSNDNVEERPEWLEGAKNIPVDPIGEGEDSLEDQGPMRTPGRTLPESLKESYDHVKDWYQVGFDQSPESDEDLSTNPSVHELPRDGYRNDLKRDGDGDGDGRNSQSKVRGGRSDAPAFLITVNKGHGIVDAFWFFFYSFNLGNVVFNIRFGNHVGDWEHTAVRFHHGQPKAVFFSEHNFGSAYGYEAVEKIGKRPVIYSATGTHAMYATPGAHPYVLPWGILHDQTDRGPLWDPVLNSHAFTYDPKNDTIRSSNLTPEAPTSWFHFAGHWGDKYYPLGDSRQYRIAGQYHYVNGPLGPKFKNLGRTKICGGPDSEPCVIKHWLGAANRPQRWHGVGEGDDLSEKDMKVLLERESKLGLHDKEDGLSAN